MRSFLPWLAPAALSLLNTGCLRDDPNHCKNDPQGVAVACDGAARFCNACASSEINRGCVAARPGGGCNYVDAIAESSTGASTGLSASSSSTTADASTSTGPRECTEEGAADPMCPAAMPYCLDGACVACTSAPASFCAELDASSPICGTQGSCVECEYGDDDACAESFVGVFCSPLGRCSGCFRHDQCGLAGCDMVNNECLPESQVLFIEGGGCDEADDTGDGTEATPFCSLAKALAAMGSRATFRVRGPGAYRDRVIRVTDGGVLAVLGNSPADRPELARVEAFTKGRAYLHDVQVTGVAEELVECATGAVVWFTRSAITGNSSGVGAEIRNCTLRLDGTVVSLNEGGGILALSQAHLEMYSAAVIANGVESTETHGIRIEGGSTMTASHATIVQNFGSATGPELSCGESHTVTVTNSIVLRNEGPSVDGCTDLTMTHTAVGDRALVDEDAGVVLVDYMPSYFADPPDGDPHLTSGTPFAEAASWQVGDAVVDIDAEPLDLQLGAANDLGCDQR